MAAMEAMLRESSRSVVELAGLGFAEPGPSGSEEAAGTAAADGSGAEVDVAVIGAVGGTAVEAPAS